MFSLLKATMQQLGTPLATLGVSAAVLLTGAIAGGQPAIAQTAAVNLAQAGEAEPEAGDATNTDAFEDDPPLRDWQFTPAPDVAPGTPPLTFPPGTIPPRGYETPPIEPPPTDPFEVYRLGIGDLIGITVPNFPEFNFQGPINIEGNVVMPILGTIPLRGLTLREVEEKISFELGNRFLRERPEVVVSLAGPRLVLVTVVGEVFEPGYYELPPGADVVDAIQFAGGSRRDADLRSVVVRRSLLDGDTLEQELDLITPLQTGESFELSSLQSGDAIIVDRLEVGNDDDYDRIFASRSNLSQAEINIRVLDYSVSGLGSIRLQNGATFADAIAAISPDPDQADLGHVALIRFDPEQGRAVRQVLNGREALMGNRTQDVPLQDNDVIIVGRTLVARVSYALNIFTQPFRDVLGFLLFFDSLTESADSLFQPGGGR
ncbi:MAG: polysaccharide export protein [Spirulinaceae cyanobacterium SM2_1_0]|nr:polysaccharide export protein [Spirulinaceae cyanobacterium SM2_1_0]